jgi:MFS family permease
MQIPENDNEYKNSRIWFVVDGATAASVNLLVTGAFLAAVLKALGVSDSFNGMISAIPSLACVIQLLGLELAKRMKKTKFFVCIFAVIHRLLFAFIFFIPFLKISLSAKAVLFITLFLLAQVLGQMIAPVAGNWISSLVRENIRGKYFANRDSIMVIVSVTVSLAAGKIFDLFRVNGDENSSFLFISGLLLVMAIINFIALSMVKEPRFSYFSRDNKEIHGTLVKKRVAKEAFSHYEKFRDTFKKVICDKRFKTSIVLTILWQSAFFFSTPYFGIYQISNLKLSYTYIMVMGFIGSVVRVIVTPLGGRIADKKSWGLVLERTLFVMAAAFTINAFTVPSNAHIMFAVFSVLTGLAWAGIAPGIFALQLDLAPDGDKTAYLGINAAIMGLFGFLSSVVGGYILQFMIDHDNRLFGQTIYGQQLLSLGSGIMLFILVCYIKYKAPKVYRIEE